MSNSYLDKKATNRVPTTSESDWARGITTQILKVFPDKEIYTCAAGISPSGTVHFGNFRDIMTSFAVAKDLAQQGKKVRLIFSWDDFDRFRKVPANVDVSFEKYVGVSLTGIPDPAGACHKNYARHFEQPLEDSMKDLGIDLEYRYQTDEYTSGRYTEQMIHALKSRTKIAEILLSFMSEKGKEEKQIDPVKFTEEFYPIAVYSRFTGKDATKILSYDGDSKITYQCLITKKEETIDIRTDHVAKLAWKIDWPMRWGEEGVVFEPGGFDHASPGGSYDASAVIAREIFNIEPPVFAGYQFVGIRGVQGKMSGSKGNALTPADLLEVYEPEILMWLYFRKNPNQAFDLAFDTEIYRQYDEYDRAIAEVLEKGDESNFAHTFSFINDIKNPKFKNPIPFKQAVALGQIMQWDLRKVLEISGKLGATYDPSSVGTRLVKAKAWLEIYNPEMMIRLRDTLNTEYVDTMSAAAKSLVKKFHEFLRDSDTSNLSVEKIEEVVYGIPRVDGIAPEDLKKAQRAFFKDVYNLLIGQEAGPRLPTFVWAVDKNKLLDLLEVN